MSASSDEKNDSANVSVGCAPLGCGFIILALAVFFNMGGLLNAFALWTARCPAP